MESREWKSFTNKKQWKEYLTNLLKTNDTALYRSIVKIYELQTEEERCRAKSIEENDRGFSKIDAKELTEIARKVLRHEELTKHEYYVMRAKMPKYWKQLMEISIAKSSVEELHRKERQEKDAKEIREQVLQRCQEGMLCEYGICSECMFRREIENEVE